MKITPELELQACLPNGQWHPLARALEVDTAGGIAKVASPSGAPVEIVGVFRVIDASTGAVLDTSVPSWAPQSAQAVIVEPADAEHISIDVALCADQIPVEKSQP
jgi:hypothetical protein